LQKVSRVSSFQARRPVAPLVAGLVILLVVSILLAVGIGPVEVPIGRTWTFLRAALFGGEIPVADAGRCRIIGDIRFPRELPAAVVGAGLATVGVVVQAMTRNALADPFVLGISPGASVGGRGHGQVAASTGIPWRTRKSALRRCGRPDCWRSPGGAC
jgi:iron complex transport system permease protein